MQTMVTNMMSTTDDPFDGASESLTFEDAYRLLFPRVLQYCLAHLTRERAEAEDIAAEAFGELQRKWDRIAPHCPETVTAFLYRTAYFKLQNRHRRAHDGTVALGDLPERYLAAPDCQPGGRLAVDAGVSLEVLLGEIRRCLSPRDHAIFQDMFVREESYEVVALRYGLSPVALRVRVCRMRKKLREALAAQYGSGARG